MNMPFKPGVSGNPGGKPKMPKPFLESVNRAILADSGKRLRQAAEALLDLAAAGEQWAVCHLADRLDGKPAQEVTGADGGPLVVITATKLDENL